MPVIIEENLRQRIVSGKCGVRALREALASERNNLCIVTLPTVGAFSHALNAAESAARQKLNELEEIAALNVPVLEKLLLEMHESIETYVCGECGQHRTTQTCNMCWEPEEY